MRLSELMAQVRDEVRDTSSSNYLYTDAQVARVVNNAQRKVFRLRAQEDQGLYNLDISLAAGNAQTVHSDVFRWTLPFWVWRVIAVYEAGSEGGRRGDLVRPAGSLHELGWAVFAGRQLEVRGIFSEARALRVYVLKEPAELSKGTLPAQDDPALTSTQIRLEQFTSLESAGFPMMREVDRYVNAHIEITEDGSPSDTGVGQHRRVTASSAASTNGGTYHPILTVEDGWETLPVAGQTYEFHAETDDAATDLLVLEAAHDLYRGGGAVGPATLVEQRLNQVRLEYRESIQPMEDHGMHSWGSIPDTSRYQGDPDREARY